MRLRSSLTSVVVVATIVAGTLAPTPAGATDPIDPIDPIDPANPVEAVEAPDGAGDLRLPFPAGDVRVGADERYGNGGDHLSIGAFALDLTPRGASIVETPVLAIGAGEIQLACIHRSGAAILRHRVSGHDGEFLYLHLDAMSVPSRFDDQHWEPVATGDVLGTLYPAAISGVFGERCFQFSSGPHLHLDFPATGVVVDGLRVDEAGPDIGDVVTSTNTVGAWTPVFVCDGLRATIVGTGGPDTLVGTPGPDVIVGLQGDDRIFGGGGDDRICAGRGDDIVVGGAGFDTLFGAQGNDVLYAASGASSDDRVDVRGSRMFGGAGHDILHGSSRWDRMQGGIGDDQLFGYEGRDWIRAGAGADRVFGGGAVDDLRGGLGVDLVEH